jgi:hypothetical protein
MYRSSGMMATRTGSDADTKAMKKRKKMSTLKPETLLEVSFCENFGRLRQVKVIFYGFCKIFVVISVI